ncbi:MAG TPA: nucleotide sugar dehydrogenase [Rhizomicrobium sp.]|jgi:UDP-N-acetyl-D-glucosamine dehydrogenase|nr:nucleotide sugar dehydrogenase [Rhizomicrobium sp.]
MSLAVAPKSLAVDHISLKRKIETREALIGIIGMGYVGQPLAIAAHRKGFQVVGFDTDTAKVAALNDGRSGIRTIPDENILDMRRSGRFHATGSGEELNQPDVILICVPTPLTRYREPDLSFVENTSRALAAVLRPGQLVCLESTTYPGTTVEVVRPILERSGLQAGRDFFLAFSPEREDPGNPTYKTTDIPKVVGADDELSRDLANAYYGAVVNRVVTVPSTATAEAVKLTENIFRCVNIALVNELKHIYERMGINIWNVIDAASTKPFGFMPFYPGPGLGGHCIPIDPFYLTWKAREYDVPTRFIELAGEINSGEPRAVVNAIAAALSSRKQKSLNGARILLVGLAYKKNVDDLRESPALVIMQDLLAMGTSVCYYDPWIPEIPMTRAHAALAGRLSIAWEPGRFETSYDAALIVTDHDAIDYGELVGALDLVVDTRNATRNVDERRERIILA